MMTKHKISIMPLFLLANVVCADIAEVYEAIHDKPLTFEYSKATVTSPLVVQAKTKDGRCKFQLSLVGLQGDSGAAGGTLTGRVDEGLCDGKPIPMMPSVATGAAVGGGELVTLLPSITVILLRSGSGKAETEARSFHDK